MDVTVVVPCFNEEKRLDPGAFHAALDAEPRLRFRFVDDGSSDGTRALLERTAAERPERIAVQSLEKNSGKGEAVRQGMIAALDEGGYAGYWDADLATPLREIPVFMEALDGNEKLEVVLGSRVRLLGREIERQLYRHLYGRVFATAVSVMLGLRVYDTQCGAKLFRSSEVVRAAFEDGRFLSRWIFDVELLARLITRWEDAGVEASEKIVEQPLRQWREIPGSKVGPRDAVRAAVELRQIQRKYRGTLRQRRSRVRI